MRASIEALLGISDYEDKKRYVWMAKHDLLSLAIAFIESSW